MIIFLNKKPNSQPKIKKQGGKLFSFKQLIPEKNQEKYQPKPINWKKVLIVLLAVAVIGTGFFLIWYYAIRGKDYLDAKQIAPEAYSTLLVDADSNKSSNLSYANETLKTSAVQMTKEVAEIYKTGGFNQDALNNYKYSNKRTIKKTEDNLSSNEWINVTSKSPSDYIFVFVDQSVYDKTGLINNIKIYTAKYLSHYVVIRIKDSQIAAIGFSNGELNATTKNYFYLPGSNYEGL